MCSGPSRTGAAPFYPRWGLRILGKTAEEAMQVFKSFKRLEDAGAVAAEVECVATEVLEEIGSRSALVTHSIGAGSGGDIIFSFMQDICGDVENPPRHAKAWADMRSVRKLLAAEREKGIAGFRDEVRAGTFPHAPHQVPMSEGERDKLRNALARWQPHR